MTAIATTLPRAITPRLSRTREWFRAHWVSLVLLTVLLCIVGAAMAWNLQGYPGRLNDDEGTYLNQGWWLFTQHQLSTYTYWYDHPPLGWVVIGAYGMLTGRFEAATSMVQVGREVMWGATVISAVLLYMLCRRLRFDRFWSAVAVLAFGLSPLAIYEHRMVFLDNLEVTWILGAFVFATSRRRSLGAAVGSAICFAGATLTKETSVIVLPVLLWVLLQHTDKRTRWWNVSVFGALYVLLSGFYFLFAILKGELFPGKGHVSLLWSLWYQFFAREGSGSLFDPASDTYRLVHVWFGLDPFLLWGGIGAAAVALIIRRLRPFAVLMLMLCLVVFKGGYLPSPYVIVVIPFAALLAAGVGDSWWGASRISNARHGERKSSWLRWGMRAPVLIGLALINALVVPPWVNSLRQQSSTHGDAWSRSATEWVEENTSKNDVVVVDQYLWGDLKRSGFNPLWYWKVNNDPQVTRDIIPNGYHSIDYVVLPYQPPGTLKTLPTLAKALKNSTKVVTFGHGQQALTVYKVKKDAS